MKNRGMTGAVLMALVIAPLAACDRAEGRTEDGLNDSITARTDDRMGQPAGQPNELRDATVDQFQKLKFLEGTWRGSGGTRPAFFEEYRVVNDSTIVMRSYADSTFRRMTDSSSIMFRTGGVSTSGGDVAVALSDTSVQFRSRGSTQGGRTITRNSSDQVTVTEHPTSQGGTETVYVLNRVRRR